MKIILSELYEVIQAAKIPPEHIDHHASDLYLKVTPETTRIIDQLEYKSMITTFTDNIDNELWYDIPFCYSPY